MAGFNMMDLMNKKTKSQKTKPSYELRDIPIGKLIPNPANAYSMDGIEELADSILIAGRVLQNLVVKPADENGNYMIISGHRRHLASKMLVEQGHKEFATVSALVENEQNETLQELMLIYTNSTARELTDAEKMRQAVRATELLKSLKEKGEFNERIRDAVAKMLNTTTGQIGRYQAISNKLTNPDLKEKFEKGKIGVSVAYEASKLSEEEQEKVAEKINAGENVSIKDVSKGKKKEEKAAGGADENERTNAEGLPMKDKKLDILPKFKLEIIIHIVEKDGKYYAGHSYDCKFGSYAGGGGYPDTRYDTPYDTEQGAVLEEIKSIAKNNPYYHKALWESGYRAVGEPKAEEKEDTSSKTRKEEKTAQTGAESATEALQENTDADDGAKKEAGERYDELVKKMGEVGFEGLEPCEKCIVSKCCEKCCKECEKPCRDKQNKCRKDQAAEYELDHHAMETAKKMLEEKVKYYSDMGKAAMEGGDKEDAKKNNATSNYLLTLIERVEDDMYSLEESIS